MKTSGCRFASCKTDCKDQTINSMNRTPRASAHRVAPRFKHGCHAGIQALSDRIARAREGTHGYAGRIKKCDKVGTIGQGARLRRMGRSGGEKRMDNGQGCWHGQRRPLRANGAEAGRRAAKPVTSCRPLAGAGGCQHRNPGHNCGQMAILDHSPSVRRSTAPERSSERLHARAADPAC